MLRAAWLVARQTRQTQVLNGIKQWTRDAQGAPALALAGCQSAGLVESLGSAHRSFAAAAEPAEQRVQLPAQVQGLAGKYAAALYISGSKAGALDQIDKDLVEVWNALAKSKEFRQFMKDPTIPKKEKTETLDSVLKELKVSELTQRFFGVLADNNRLREIVRICNNFDDLMSAARGEVNATLTTASGLSRNQLDEIKSGLNQILDKGQTLIVHERIDPTIIGGIVIDVADKHIDLSISSRVKRIQQLILETV